MKKHLTIIGGGFSSWIAASIFADSGYSIDIFEGKNESFGSQQITPNGWEALSNLIELKNIQKYFEPFYNIYIKRLNSKNNLELLYHHDLVEQNYNYGSIERKSIISFFKNHALKNNTIKIINSNVTNIVSNNNYNELIDDKGQIFKTNLMIGSDGIDGVSRKFVVGSNNYIKKKKIYRTISFKDSAYNLSKTILQVLIQENGYYVIYPTIINNKKATNYIFVPQNNETELPTLNNKILNYLIPEDLEWKITYASFNDGEKTSIYKNGLFLFGDAAFAIPPHTAQAGNQILEDAAYIKKLLNENYDFYEIVNMFVKERYLKKDMLAKKSKMVGEILNAQNIAKYFRDYSLKLNGNDLLDKILSPIWTTESYE
ncbi:MAG: hypothetical protein CM15mP114_06220 [Alphaproteobacteria bacterium]|nr:MAG: hypothetical protein CM15mP114_06220 [Alphaproteobacteria bacterium]